MYRRTMLGLGRSRTIVAKVTSVSSGAGNTSGGGSGASGARCIGLNGSGLDAGAIIGLSWSITRGAKGGR